MFRSSPLLILTGNKHALTFVLFQLNQAKNTLFTYCTTGSPGIIIGLTVGQMGAELNLITRFVPTVGSQPGPMDFMRLATSSPPRLLPNSSSF